MTNRIYLGIISLLLLIIISIGFFNREQTHKMKNHLKKLEFQIDSLNCNKDSIIIYRDTLKIYYYKN